MAIRNFWVTANIDGRGTKLAGGPRSKDGGMDITLYQRDNGCIETALRIRCWEYNGKLFTDVAVNDERVARVETAR